MISKDLMASEDISGLRRPPQWLQKASMTSEDLIGVRNTQMISLNDLNWPHDLNDFKKPSLVSNDLYWPQVTSN